MTETAEQKVRDDALAEGMDCEYMRICGEIDDLIKTRNSESSYGKGQIYILKELRKIINWNGYDPPKESSHDSR